MDSTTSNPKYIIRADLLTVCFSVVDINGEVYFDVQQSDLGDGSVKLLDSKGKTIAICRKEKFGPGKIANIILKSGLNKKPEGELL